MSRAITMKPATKERFTALPTASVARRKVAGYARVSTDSEEQQTSYEAQVDYYTRYIQSREDWEFVGVYTDEGISATNTKHRYGSNRWSRTPLLGRLTSLSPSRSAASPATPWTSSRPFTSQRSTGVTVDVNE